MYPIHRRRGPTMRMEFDDGPDGDEGWWASLARYLAGESGGAEAAAVEAWAAASAANRELLDEMRETWSAARGEPRWDTEAAFTRVRARIAAAEPEPAPVRVIPLRRPARRSASPWLRAAAAAVLLLAGAGAVRELDLVSSHAPAPLVREVATPAGTRARIVLADGTEVQLGPGSRLRYPAEFGGGERRVMLEGEGYFHVARDERRPFRVHAAGSVTRVLGTRFGVSTSSAGVRVVVEEGRVAFGRGNEPAAAGGVELTAGWSARMAGGAVGAPERVNAARALGWTEGRLGFEDAPLTEVASALERWYGTRVRLAVPGADTMRLTADLSGASLAEALEIVGVSLSLDVRAEDSGVVIRPGA
ncbi:FecR family protein [Longimicrobium terrae]|uniref:Ferric-dicitrate binding protein FerR (Iron transport regulator) n=1 Tax=Longimicrobium terrae TaxID=1639882 RepID=A0A841H3A9_9BACT|nr:FecR domain-containing protein [Longimicrobium terrae]MBB4638070.1 ferric-dicitrate binding protein FerR (iron transport regulator) [Longimicrobium terrae]MBB6072442.1 ferric-dicitrate binding protein FerR (iron transport regulator) [Longimicrobium terrae]NNC32144.1 hypothetical protein [Longimicrobium terrae]